MGANESWLNPNCIPVISDVHGHVEGLQRVLDTLRLWGVHQPPLILGDMFWTGAEDRDPRAVLDWVTSARWRAFVRGNTEQYLTSGWLEAWEPADDRNRAEKAAMLRFKVSFSASELRFLERLPLLHDFTFGSARVRICHASPTDADRGLTLTSAATDWHDSYGSDAVDLLLTGHLHRAFTHIVGGRLHVCVGAVGRLPSDADGASDFALLNPTPAGLAILHARIVDGRATLADT